MAVVVVAGCGAMRAQQGDAAAAKPMGTVATSDVRVSGGLEVAGARASLLNNVSLTALDHTAEITLARGGEVAVCATSEFHMLRSGTADGLMFSLDRGAFEVHGFARPQDAVVTPDLRFTPMTLGPLDLRMRVTREGDTCVENRGEHAPVIAVVDGFGTGSYRLLPGQHVLFEHGSVHEVVDHERSECGCPSGPPAIVATAPVNGTTAVNAEQAAVANPFPVAQSAGLSVQPEAVKIQPDKNADAALSYGGGEAAAKAPADAIAATPAKQSSAAAPQTATATGPPTPPPAPPGAHDIAHKIGRFFKRLFGSHS